MSTNDEDRALVSIIASHEADVLKYTRLSYFKELFPARQRIATFIANYLDTSGHVPSMKVVRRKFTQFSGPPARPEPLVAVMNELRELLVENVVAQYADDMEKAHSKQDSEKYVELSESMADKVRQIRAPIESGALDVESYTTLRLAEMEKDATSLVTIYPTGLPPLDREWGGGLRGGRLYTMSSLVNLGKTYVSCAIANSIASAGHRVLYASLEMSRPDIAERVLCLRYKLNVNHYIKLEMPEGEKLSREDWYKNLLKTRQALEHKKPCKGKVYIIGNEGGMIQPKTLRSVAKEHGVQAIFIDACQDIRDNNLTRERVGGLYNAIAELNAVATELNVPVFMTVQLSGEVEKKGLKNGNLANIAWGQVFAQKSHSVITMLGDRSTMRRDVTCDKARDGQVGVPFVIDMQFPEIEIVASDLHPGGYLLSEEDLFESADDIASELAGLVEQQANEEPAAKPQQRQLPKVASKPSYEIVEDNSVDPEPSSEYLRKKAERSKKRLRNKLRRNL